MAAVEQLAKGPRPPSAKAPARGAGPAPEPLGSLPLTTALGTQATTRPIASL
ncbi:hypothetical protein VTI74DRAFT_2561 [Chaetomium olivicolor]